MELLAEGVFDIAIIGGVLLQQLIGLLLHLILMLLLLLLLTGLILKQLPNVPGLRLMLFFMFLFLNQAKCRQFVHLVRQLSNGVRLMLELVLSLLLCCLL